ncbi:restriction endonuclease subunit S [Escherichia coli]|uniref:restriction endonuclease subunit S n=1 Tax=Escherichia coli TaxID=562 RepID=UPI000DD6B816|nr:restriction endonuclease subunit S [Escherichia coli]MCH7148542.1 restriction endonuclease subunit S [Escherichia coli]RXP96615.1 restriction endonuclease subunit S [Escherichia coli]RXQ04249.1 restriction endonuclease subunit S [Escherichia coli]HBD0717183.1 restriction endonuclease subunit S [Escherichia coli]
MGSKWETVRLGDLTKWSSGGTPNKSEDSYWNGTIPWISASSMEGHLYSDSKLKITEDGLINGSRLAPANSILLLVRGSILHQKIQVGLATKAVAFNQDVKCLIVNNDMIDPWYLLLWFKAKEQDLLKIVESTGIGAGKLDTKLLMDYPVEIPPKEIKEYIRFFGKAIFDKTTLNENINYNLEKMSQTLFKSWFVDFDPVIDNALDAGNPIPEALQARAELRQKVRNSADFKPLPAEIRSLFPSEFEETELGWVPKTWTISNLGKEFNITMGQSPSGSTYNEDRVGLPFFQGKTDFGFRFPSERIYCTDPKRVANKLDTLLSVRAPVGVTNLASTECIIGRGLSALRHKSGNIAFTYYSVSNLSDYFSVFNGEGTVFGSINQKDLKQLPLICPPTELINKFEELSGKWEEKIFLHCGEIENLSKLRDTLLPKLISGELSLEDLPDLSTDTEAA